MAKKFQITAPDGHVIEVTGPDDATPEQAKMQAQRMYQPKTENKVEPPSFLDKTISNIPSSLGRVLSHPFGEGTPMPVKENFARGEYPEQFQDVYPKVKQFLQHPIDNTINAVKSAVSEAPVESAIGVLAGGRQAFPNLAEATGSVVSGAAKGAYNSATEMVPFSRFGHKINVPKPLLGAAAGETAGWMSRLPHAPTAGLIIGGAAPIVKGAYEGAKEGLSNYRYGKGFKSLAEDLPFEKPPVNYTDEPLGGYNYTPKNYPVTPPDMAPEAAQAATEPPRTVPNGEAQALQVKPLGGEAPQARASEPAPQNAPVQSPVIPESNLKPKGTDDIPHADEVIKPGTEPTNNRSVYEKLAEEGIKKRAQDAEAKYNDVYENLIKDKMTPDEVRELAQDPAKLAMMDYKIKTLRHAEDHPTKAGKKKYGGGMNPGMIEELAKRLESEQ